MKCSRCQRENEPNGHYCIFCGAPLAPPEYVPPLSNVELVEQIQALRQEVRQLGASLNERVNVLEQLQGLVKPSTTEVPPIPVPPEAAASEPQTVMETPEPAEIQTLPEAEPGPAVPPAGARPARTREWEQILGSNWLVRIGVLAVIFGIGFFLKFAFDNEAFPPLLRILLVVVVGLALMGAGYFWRTKYAVFSQALAGGGIAVIYLAVFAVFAAFHLMNIYLATGLLFVVGLGAAAIAIRYNSMALAILGIIGSFGAPFFLEFAAPKPVAFSVEQSIYLLVYILIVDVGVLALSAFRNWRWFNLLAICGSLITYGGWYGLFGYKASLIITEGSNTIIFLIFVGATTLFHIVWQRKCQAFDYIIMLINAAGYFGFSYGLMWPYLRDWMGGYSFLMAAFYGGLAYLARKKYSQNLTLSYFATGIAIAFLTTAIPVQFGDRAWTTVAWAIEAAMLMWFSFILPKSHFRIFSYMAFILTTVRLMAFDTRLDTRSAQPVFNERSMAFLISIAIMYLTSYFIWRYGHKHPDEEKQTRPVFATFLIGANIFSLWLMGAEILSAAGKQAAGMPGAVPIFFVIFAGATLLPFALWRRPVKTYDLLLVFLDATFYLGVSTSFFGSFRAWMGGMYLLLAIFFGVLTYVNLITKRENHDQLTMNAVVISAVFLTLAIPVQFERSIWTTVTWSAEMAALVWISFRPRLSILGYFSYAILVLITGNLLIFNNHVDIKSFQPIINQRFLSFMAGIAGAYAAVFLMWRKRKIWPEWRMPGSTFLVITNFLTIVILSLEVWAYLEALALPMSSAEYYGAAGRTLHNAQNFSLTALWAIYAIILLTIGTMRTKRAVRLWALGLLAVPIIKLFIYDIWALETVYKIIAFVGLGILLIAGGYLYQHYSKNIREFVAK